MQLFSIKFLLAAMAIIASVEAGGKRFDIQHHSTHHHHHHGQHHQSKCLSRLKAVTLSACGALCAPEQAKALDHACSTGNLLSESELRTLCCPTTTQSPKDFKIQQASSFGGKVSERECTRKIHVDAISHCGGPCGQTGSKALVQSCASGRQLSSEEISSHCCPKDSLYSIEDNSTEETFNTKFGGKVSSERSCARSIHTFALHICSEPCAGTGAQALKTACNSNKRVSREDVKRECCP